MPILVPTTEKTARDGRAYVAPEQTETPASRAVITDVRRVNGHVLSDLKKAVANKDWKRVGAIQLLRDAERRRDSRATLQAFAILKEPLFGFGEPIKVEEPLKPALAKMDRAIDGLITTLATAIGTSGSARYVEHLVSLALSRTRLVPWLPDDTRIREIGIYCPDAATAIAAKFFLGDLRICPRCKKPFTAKKTNEYYCSTSCREAHRLARWRDKKRQEKGRKHVKK